MLIALIVVFIILLAQLGRALRTRAGREEEEEANHLQRAQLQAQECRRIVNFAHFAHPGERRTTTLKERLYLRAQPNQRLLKAFGIRNSFTLPSVSVHDAFLRKERQLLNGVLHRDWTEQYHNARRILRGNVSSSAAAMAKQQQQQQRRLRLAPCIRSICWRLVSAMLFKVDPMAIPEDDVDVVTEEINVQWQRSKRDPEVDQSPVLNAALERVFGSYGRELTPTEGLALIMPAYETLWRVVLLTYVSAFHRDRDSREACEKLIGSVPECLGSRTKTEETALMVGKEGLRLFPSTKRVYRATSLDGPSDQISADIESCHRDPAIWGPDALEFRPHRFQQLSKLQRDAYMPFGCRPHLCPAVAGFGDRIVTMLVVALGRELNRGDENGVVLLQSDCGKPLPTGRDDMENWYLYLADNSSTLIRRPQSCL